MQPIKIEKINEKGEVTELLYEYEWNEFVDIFPIQPFTRVTYRFRFVDRPEGDLSLGGGIGRWLIHCHQLLHSSRGMISELVVLSKG